MESKSYKNEMNWKMNKLYRCLHFFAICLWVSNSIIMKKKKQRFNDSYLKKNFLTLEDTGEWTENSIFFFQVQLPDEEVCVNFALMF